MPEQENDYDDLDSEFTQYPEMEILEESEDFITHNNPCSSVVTIQHFFSDLYENSGGLAENMIEQNENFLTWSSKSDKVTREKQGTFFPKFETPSRIKQCFSDKDGVQYD